MKPHQYDGPSPDELSMISSVAYLQNVLPFLEAEIDTMCRAVESRVFTQINSNQLTAQAAQEAWMELYGYRRLLKRLEARIKSGQTVGHNLAHQMKIGD